MIAKRGMRPSLTTIFDKFFLDEAHAVFEPCAVRRDLLLSLLQLISDSDVLQLQAQEVPFRIA